MNDHTPDRAALRDRIADALLTTPRTDYDSTPNHRNHRYDARCALCAYDVDALADAVLSVLPPVSRAAILREEADRIDATREQFPVAVQNGITWATAELRRHAAECPQCGTTGACNGGSCPLRRMAGEEQPATEARCTCADAGDCFAPAGHYRDCPKALWCPECDKDLSSYHTDDLVFRKDDTRPYCSGECVIAAHRSSTPPAVVAEQPAAADTDETPCATPSPDGQYQCVLPPNHQGMHADKHLADVTPNGTRTIWETPCG